MTRWIYWLTALLVFATINGQIAAKSTLLRRGRSVYLELAPVDPRSLMQGDYMVLDYGVSRDLQHAERDGDVVLAVDARGVGRFARVDDLRPLAANEQRLHFKKHARVSLGAESFFFQEGDRALYQNAKYGELKVTPTGESVLVGLCDANVRPLGRR